MNETEKMIRLIRSKTHDELIDVVNELNEFIIKEIGTFDVDEATKIKLYNMCKDRTNVEKLLIDALAGN